MDDESALLKGARRLDKIALTQIFDLYAPALYNYVLRLCHDPIDSDNVVKDVSENLLEKLAAGSGTGDKPEGVSIPVGPPGSRRWRTSKPSSCTS